MNSYATQELHGSRRTYKDHFYRWMRRRLFWSPRAAPRRRGGSGFNRLAVAGWAAPWNGRSNASLTLAASSEKEEEEEAPRKTRIWSNALVMFALNSALPQKRSSKYETQLPPSIFFQSEPKPQDAEFEPPNENNRGMQIDEFLWSSPSSPLMASSWLLLLFCPGATKAKGERRNSVHPTTLEFLVRELRRREMMKMIKTSEGRKEKRRGGS